MVDDEKIELSVVSRRLKEIKNQRGLTLAQISKLTDLPKPSIESYMSTKNPQKPGHDAIIALSEGLGVPVDWLLFDDTVSQTEGTMFLALSELMRERFIKDKVSTDDGTYDLRMDGRVMKNDRDQYVAVLCSLFVMRYRDICARGYRECDRFDS